MIPNHPLKVFWLILDATRIARIDNVARSRRSTSAAVAIMFLSAMAGCRTAPRSQAQPAFANVVKVTVTDDFDFDAPGDAWNFRTPSLWRIAHEGRRRFLQMAIPPDQPVPPGIFQPWESALYGKYEFRSFSLSCRVRIDREVSVKGRDACIIFGRQDDNHFYSVCLSNDNDDFHNNIIVVDGRDHRPLLAAARPAPAITDRNWHWVDMIRDVHSGPIRVYVDDDTKVSSPSPLFEVKDRRYEWGAIGLGSLDDHASFARFAIEGQARPPTGNSAVP